MLYNYFDKTSTSTSICADKSVTHTGIGINSENGQLAYELKKPVIRKFQQITISGMHLISKYNKGIRFLLCVIDIYFKYASVVTSKNKKRYCNY